MKELIFATNNENKALEIERILGGSYKIKTLKESGIVEDIPETQATLEGNAKQKADYIKEKYGLDCFADDTGLEIETLNGEPGVLSARYAGEEKRSDLNMAKVLSELKGKNNRSAQFRTIIALHLNGEYHEFEGVCKGEITTEQSGTEGFGYDPIFQPEGFELSFAEMSMDDKNKISHRGRAVQKLAAFLSQKKES